MKNDPLVKEYVRKLNDEDVRWLNIRLTQRLGGDLGEAANFLSRDDREIDRWLASATNCDAFFDKIDTIAECVEAEYKRRQATREAKEQVALK